MRQIREQMKKGFLPAFLLFLAAAAPGCGSAPAAEKTAEETCIFSSVRPDYSETRKTEKTEEETEAAGEVYWMVPQAGDCLLSAEEQEQLNREALQAAGTVSFMYRDLVTADAPAWTSGVSGFTLEQQEAVVEALGRQGLVSAEETDGMKNPEALRAFYENWQEGQDAMVTVCVVQRDGLIGFMTFVFREGRIQTYYAGVRWKEGGVPEIQGISVSNIREINLTEKGYFIYAPETVMAHGGLRQYWRTVPLPEGCEALTEKYIRGLSYVNYNMLVTDWDAGSVEQILMPCMYEDICRIAGESGPETEDGRIPAEDFERIMISCFPVSAEQLRACCGYDRETDSYRYERIYSRPYAPFGEVVDYTENADGTILLTVDGVWPDDNTDLAFRNRILVQPMADGTFRYLSNSIEEMERSLSDLAGSP